MKKFGFTLAELMITLGIVAVIATITAPSLQNLMPDKNKIRVIKSHKIISDVTHELLNDPTLYSVQENYGGLDVDFDGLKDLSKTRKGASKAIPNDNDYNKYGKLFASKMEVNGTTETEEKKVTFSTFDGASWTIEVTGVEWLPGSHERTIEHSILVDLNGTDAPNCIGSSSCKKPDQFKFKVGQYGRVTGHSDDKLTIQYLKTRDKLNNKKEDYSDAGITD